MQTTFNPIQYANHLDPVEFVLYFSPTVHAVLHATIAIQCNSRSVHKR
jgi:hypothetical protein